MCDARDCNRCVYSTRDGDCRRFTCRGTVTVDDVKTESVKEFAEWLEEKDLLTLWHGDDDNETLSAEKVLNMYKKEQK